MKKLLLFILPIALFSCGGDDEKSKTLDLTEYGLEATIDAGNPKRVNAVNFSTNYELKVLKKAIDLEYEDNLVVTITESDKNRTADVVDNAKKFGDEVVESSDTHYIIKSEGRDNTSEFDCVYFYEKDGVWFSIKVADKEKYFYCTSMDQVKKGSEIAPIF